MICIVEAARSFIGVPWLHQGRSREGIDCLGLLVLSEAACGREMADRANYGRIPVDNELREGLEEHYGMAVLGEAPALEDLLPGDKALLMLGRDPSHVGIIGDSPNGKTLIHSYASGPCRVAEMRIDQAWRHRIVAVFR